MHYASLIFIDHSNLAWASCTATHDEGGWVSHKSSLVPTSTTGTSWTSCRHLRTFWKELLVKWNDLLESYDSLPMFNRRILCLVSSNFEKEKGLTMEAINSHVHDWSNSDVFNSVVHVDANQVIHSFPWQTWFSIESKEPTWCKLFVFRNHVLPVGEGKKDQNHRCRIVVTFQPASNLWSNKDTYRSRFRSEA